MWSNHKSFFQIKSFVLKPNQHTWFNRDLNQIIIWICPSLIGPRRCRSVSSETLETQTQTQYTAFCTHSKRRRNYVSHGWSACGSPVADLEPKEHFRIRWLHCDDVQGGAKHVLAPWSYNKTSTMLTLLLLACCSPVYGSLRKFCASVTKDYLLTSGTINFMWCIVLMVLTFPSSTYCT